MATTEHSSTEGRPIFDETENNGSVIEHSSTEGAPIFNNNDQPIIESTTASKPEENTSATTSTPAVSTPSANAAATTTPFVKQPLTTTPFHTPYVTSYHRKVTESGEVIDKAYLKRYYSVIDAEIYFGNEYVEDVCYIDWNVNQATADLHGYNSFRYDELARGYRIIQGVFDINFTSPNYLFQILKAANQDSISYAKNLNFDTPTNMKVSGIDTGLDQYNYTGSTFAPLWRTTFDIDVIFGNKNQEKGSTPVHIILEGVAIQSCSMVMSASAAESPPSIRERYSFIARDIRTYGSASKQYNTSKSNFSSNNYATTVGGKNNSSTSKKKYDNGSSKDPNNIVGKTITGNVYDAHDGDTVWIKTTDGVKIKIRFTYVDSPEYSSNVGYQAFGKEAQEAVEGLLQNKNATVQITNYDSNKKRYGGTPIIENINVCNYLLENGLAFWYDKFDNSSSEERKKHEDLQNAAKERKIGIWSTDVTFPERFRYRKESEKEYNFAYGNLKEKGQDSARKEAIDWLDYTIGKEKYNIIDEGIEDEYNYYIKAKKK